MPLVLKNEDGGTKNRITPLNMSSPSPALSDMSGSTLARNMNGKMKMMDMTKYIIAAMLAV